MTSKLKIGFLIRSNRVPEWMFQTISELQKLNAVDMDFFGLAPTPVKNNYSLILINYLYTWIAKFESKLFYEIGPNAFKVRQINKKDALNFIELKNFPDHLESKKYDLLINFSNDLLPSYINAIPKHGCWNVFSGNSDMSNKFPGLQEVFNKEKIHVLSIIKMETLEKPKEIIFQSVLQVEKYDLLRNNNRVFWKASTILIREIERLYSGTSMPEVYLKFHFKKINAVFYLKYFLVVPLIYIQFIFNKLKRKFIFNQWILMYQFNTTSNIDFSFKKFKKIIPPKDRIWADPFAIFKDDEYHIFLEEQLINKSKGYISYLKLDKNGQYTIPKKIIDESFHMSYPFLIEEEGTLYMIPETCENKTISLYKCAQFPCKWEFVMHLMEEVEAVDSTVYFKEGTYWLFTNMRSNQGSSLEVELFLFYSNSLLSNDWKLHPKYPIKSDMRVSRPAGTIFKKGADIFRPSQNSTYHYGYGLNFSKITKMNKIEYEEIVYKKIIPIWERNIISIHTYNQSHDLTIVDVEQKRFKKLL
jgi:hypothetical protein